MFYFSLKKKYIMNVSSVNTAFRDTDAVALVILLLAEVWVGALRDAAVPLFSECTGLQAYEIHLCNHFTVVTSLKSI